LREQRLIVASGSFGVMMDKSPDFKYLVGRVAPKTSDPVRALACPEARQSFVINI